MSNISTIDYDTHFAVDIELMKELFLDQVVANLVREFVNKHKISNPDDIDYKIDDALNLVEDLCELVGYHQE